MRNDRIIGMALAGLTLVWAAPGAGADDLTFEARPVSAWEVELRWNQDVDAVIERKAKGGAFEPIRRFRGRMNWNMQSPRQADAGGDVPFRRYVDSGLAADAEYTYRFTVPNDWRHDFGPAGSACETNWRRVSEKDVYSPEKGFGFAAAGGSSNKRGRGNPVMQSHVGGPSAFIQDVPNGRYRVSVGGVSLYGFIDYQVTINGAEALPKTKAAVRGRPVELKDYLVDVQDGKITVELGADRVWNYLKIVSADEPVTALATATVRTHSIAHMAGLDEEYPNIEFWRALARDIPERIRQHRMGTLSIKTTPGANVTVNQVEHEFWFGTAIAPTIFDGRVKAAEDRERYLAILKDNFNSAVDEGSLKWRATEARKDVYTYETADAILEWCEANGLRMRGHTIFWAHAPAWLKKMDAAELRAKLEQRARDVMTRYKGRIGEYDVNNEMILGRFPEDRLGETIRHDMFKWCREADPDAVLYVNDHSILNGIAIGAYEKQIADFLAAGVPVGGIGVQGHFEAGGVNPAQVAGNLDRLAKFNLPIKITEFDIDSKDEDIKARGLVDLYTVGFSHPAVDGILMWGFWEGAHWKPDAALWKKDWTPTKAAKAYRHLVYEKWWTKFEGTADEQGICEVPVFFGRHAVAVDGQPAQEVFLGRKEGKKTITVTAER